MDILKEKGILLENQIKTWDDIIKRPFNKTKIDAYTRTRQILLNGIEIESWGFKHHFLRTSNNYELNKTIANIRRIEDMQQSCVNWLTPSNQTVLDTTLAYEQVAVDLTAWLAQNEDDEYVKETFNFGLLEDFDHLYRYAQFSYLLEEMDPNEILQNKTDVMFARPTQYHHNLNSLRLRKPYDKINTMPKTKINILTLLSAEQQTHNFYAEHGFMYGNMDLKKLYAEICDVEEEHVTMYESLIDPNETMLEKWVLHEFCEVCNYYNCYIDEGDEKLKLIWEEMMQMEIEHLKIAAQNYEKTEKKDAKELIGEDLIMPCSFKTQKNYVEKILLQEIDKRLGCNMDYEYIKNLPEHWGSYKIQTELSKKGAPSEKAIELINTSIKRDIAFTSKDIFKQRKELIIKSAEEKTKAPNTITADMYKNFDNIELNLFIQ